MSPEERLTDGDLPGAEGRPLSDVTVLELGHIVAGPFCAMVLADLGAEVIKVERPDGGDAVRDSSPVGNSSFNYVNRNKLSVTLDLTADAGGDVFEELLAEADVVVENFASGTAERLGVGPEHCRAVNEELVYCSVTGFNPGPYEEYPALDPVAEALSGMMSVTGTPDEPPVRSGTSLADMTASLYAAVSVLGALRQRDMTGEGQHVTVPLFESTVALMGYWLAYAQAHERAPEPLGASHPNWAPYDVFPTADDEWVFIGPSSEASWTRLCEALAVDLDDEERFETLPDRRANRDALRTALATTTVEYDADALVARLRTAGVPVAPVNDALDVVDDDHLVATDALGEIDAAEGVDGTLRVPTFPGRSTAYDTVEATDPPALGEDTDGVLAALGYDAAERERLREDEVI